jgi:DNA polymerase elongation subunit (family B)
MSKHLLYTFGIVAFLSSSAFAQTELVADQNPNYQKSQDKYTRIADSVNKWHSTTVQETYKAIDYLEDKRIAKESRRAFRQQIRLARAMRGDVRYYYNPSHFNRPYYHYRPNYHSYRNRYGFSNSHLYSTIPLAVGLAFWCR